MRSMRSLWLCSWARQTGKSTLAQSEPFSRQRLYLTLDDLGTHERARIAPEDFLRGAERLTIDEVQRDSWPSKKTGSWPLK